MYIYILQFDIVVAMYESSYNTFTFCTNQSLSLSKKSNHFLPWVLSLAYKVDTCGEWIVIILIM